MRIKTMIDLNRLKDIDRNAQRETMQMQIQNALQSLERRISEASHRKDSSLLLCLQAEREFLEKQIAK
jgi:ribosome-associated translation inhibitor RaiA